MSTKRTRAQLLRQEETIKSELTALQEQVNAVVTASLDRLATIGRLERHQEKQEQEMSTLRRTNLEQLVELTDLREQQTNQAATIQHQETARADREAELLSKLRSVTQTLILLVQEDEDMYE